MNLNTKGAIDHMFLALIIVVLAVGGFLYYRVSEAKDELVQNSSEIASANSEAAQGDGEPKDTAGVETTNLEERALGMIDGVGWKKVSEESPAYTLNEQTASLNFYDQNPEVFYSINNPVKCVLEGDGWIEYESFGDGEYFVAEQNSCIGRVLSPQAIGSTEISFLRGGTLGRVSSAGVFQINDIWYVVQDYSAVDPETTATNADGTFDAEDVYLQLESSILELIGDLVT